jgi:capsular polysaccharide biosynthesis protein
MKMIGEHIVPKKHKITNTKIFLSRSRLGPRMRPLNKKTETMVEDMFALRGFEIIHSQELSFEDQIEIGRNADWLAGLAGSQMHLSVFSDVPKVHMFNIKPSFFEVPEYLEVIKTLGGDMHEFIANDFGSFSQSQKSELAIRRPWDISPDDLHKLEQEIENWLAT